VVCNSMVKHELAVGNTTVVADCGDRVNLLKSICRRSMPLRDVRSRISRTTGKCYLDDLSSLQARGNRESAGPGGGKGCFSPEMPTGRSLEVPVPRQSA